MKKSVLLIGMFVLVIAAICGFVYFNKDKAMEEQPSVNDSAIKESLVGGTWKVTKAYDNKKNTINEEVDPSDIYGKYYMEGGITFYTDETVIKRISPYAEEEKGTYTINTEKKTITLKLPEETLIASYTLDSNNKVIVLKCEIDGKYIVKFQR